MNLNTLIDALVADLGRSLQPVDLAMQLVEFDSFTQNEIKSAADSDSMELLVLGIAEASNDTIYIADSYNSKVKRLNIKTRQVDQVHSNYLTSYFFNVVINWKFK